MTKRTDISSHVILKISRQKHYSLLILYLRLMLCHYYCTIALPDITDSRYQLVGKEVWKMPFILFALVNAAAITNKMLRICFSVSSKHFLYTFVIYFWAYIVRRKNFFLPGYHRPVLMHVLECCIQNATWPVATADFYFLSIPSCAFAGRLLILFPLGNLYFVSILVQPCYGLLSASPYFLTKLHRLSAPTA